MVRNIARLTVVSALHRMVNEPPSPPAPFTFQPNAAWALAISITRPASRLTWSHRDGWPEAGLPDYQSMQFQIDRGYLGIAQELGVPVAPVGYAWLIAIGQNPQLDLWQEDGSHPTEQGTYLAACVFYAAIFRQSPAGLAYLAGLPKETAHLLQTVSADIVLSDPKQWYLP